MSQKKCILLVEASYPDLVLMSSALEDHGLRDRFRAVRDGTQALHYLSSRRRRAADLEPGVIFLDLSLPDMDGFEILQCVKQNKRLKKIPVVIFSSSDTPADGEKARRLGAEGFYKTPPRFEDFQETFIALASFWAERLQKRLEHPKEPLLTASSPPKGI